MTKTPSELMNEQLEQLRKLSADSEIRETIMELSYAMAALYEAMK
jgi:CMP-2-keto-3-deoxyoctulosonic acid synthetase